MARTVSVSTALFDGYSMELAIDEIAASGALSVEPAYIKGYLDFDESAFDERAADRLRGLIERAGLGVTAVSAHMDLGAADALAMLRRRVGFAARLGARYVITNTGAAAHVEPIAGVLERIAPDCEAAGISLALENPGHGSGDLIGTGSDGAALLDRLGAPYLCLNYDVGNVFTYNLEAIRPQDDLETAARHIGHLHLKDVRSDAAGWAFTAIGDGAIDYPALWKKMPRDLPVAIELPLRLARIDRADPVRQPDRVALAKIRDALRRSLAFVERLEKA